MAFDPDAYLAQDSAPVSSGGFDPDAYLASADQPAAPVIAEVKPKLSLPTRGEHPAKAYTQPATPSYGRGAAMSGLQGATLGFSDEVGALFGAPLY